MKTILAALPLVIIAGCNSTDAELPQGTALVDAINGNAVSVKQVGHASKQATKDGDKKTAAVTMNGAKTGITTVKSSPKNSTPAKAAKGGNQSTPDTKYKVVNE